MDWPKGGVVIANDKHLSVRAKYVFCLVVATLWVALSVMLSKPWLHDLGKVTTPVFALVSISFIAYIPGFMNSFLISTLLLDRRPVRAVPSQYPSVSILIAAYQEETAIAKTLKSMAGQDYPGDFEVLVLSDGSTDATVENARRANSVLAFPPNGSVRLLDFPKNRGKAAVLNEGLRAAKHDLIITVDGDSLLRPDSITNIVERLLSDPADTVAVAGAVLVGNTRVSLMTKAQEWDYFHGIAAVKRMQSMYHGTLVAQGAFSIYRRDGIEAVGGWPECIGEDIVLTWALLKHGYRVGYAEDAIVFTNVPPTLSQFAQQRKRWSRGLVEAFRLHWRLLFRARPTTLFVWWNLLFLPLDVVYTFVFIPGVVAAIFFRVYWIAGLMTLAVLPLAGVWNIVIFRIQNGMFKTQNLKVRPNYLGLGFYLLCYTLLMQPVCVWGYVSELTGRKKVWGTK